uniref:Uncharacterized protein n=1 Tax=Brassica campestris TaxID=3711 RepID=A0A3P5Z8H8_BRACM|nr:unnamed protein product [Brassica rapa]
MMGVYMLFLSILGATSIPATNEKEGALKIQEADGSCWVVCYTYATWFSLGGLVTNW